MSDERGVFAVTATKRRRYLWCAWFTHAPSRVPFARPDAWAGGARTIDEARAQAEAAAGGALREIEGMWAGAWVRVQKGLPPWIERVKRAPSPVMLSPDDPHRVLGVAPSASLADVKRAFRALALVHHPDRGGEAEAFLTLKRAYDKVVEKRERREKAAEKKPKKRTRERAPR